MFLKKRRLPPESSWLLRHLKSRKKWTAVYDDNIISTRTKKPEETLSEIIPICKTIGITRLADITCMDRLYIPNYLAVLPGVENKLWIYGGKGPTKRHAKASALMELIERYSSLPSVAVDGFVDHDNSNNNSSKLSSSGIFNINSDKMQSIKIRRKFIRGSYLQLSKFYTKVLHPHEVVEAIRDEYKEDMVMDFLPGFDLLWSGNNSEEENSNNNEMGIVLVPAALALFGYYASPPSTINPFLYKHTSGLASGNVIEEGICHALCEVIERDAVSIAELSASTIPYTILQNIIKSLKENGYPDLSSILSSTDNADDIYKFVDDTSLFPDVDISEVAEEFEPIKFLVKKFAKAQIPLLIKNITLEDIDIPTFIASSLEWKTSDYGHYVFGYGAHPDARIALIRAITEVAQGRAADIQGIRDDLMKCKESDAIHKKFWQFMSSTISTSSKRNNEDNSRNIVKFSEIRTYVNADILDDIKLILQRLKQAGLKRAIIVDLTAPDIGIPVVRAIVPGLETFTVSRSVMGRRARHYFWKHLQQ